MQRAQRVTETVATLKAAFAGEPFEFRGRTVQVTPPPYRPGVRYRVEEDDIRALWWRFRTGERSEALRGLVPKRHTVHGVGSLRDPAPLLVSARKLARALGAGLRRGEG